MTELGRRMIEAGELAEFYQRIAERDKNKPRSRLWNDPLGIYHDRLDLSAFYNDEYKRLCAQYHGRKPQ